MRIVIEIYVETLNPSSLSKLNVQGENLREENLAQPHFMSPSRGNDDNNRSIDNPLRL